MNPPAEVRALFIAHLPSRTVPAVLQRLADQGFRLDPKEDPTKVAWASTSYSHSFLMAWFVGPRGRLADWEGAPGVMGFTEEDDVAWS